ncbi:hypothetical protein CK203_046000 [Vitis vinifera]|uniref:Uncharacterized protein n=1 Tax=Vitis vinifera TaxID=29760 RepID=A0A438HH21_VITVI|nr:hypothetical protein CK203_046000 [Vitis vinifera]
MARPTLFIIVPSVQNLTKGIAICVGNRGTGQSIVQAFVTCLGILSPSFNPNLVNTLDQYPMLHVLILLLNLIMPLQAGFLIQVLLTMLLSTSIIFLSTPLMQAQMT